MEVVSSLCFWGKYFILPAPADIRAQPIVDDGSPARIGGIQEWLASQSGLHGYGRIFLLLAFTGDILTYVYEEVVVDKGEYLGGC